MNPKNIANLDEITNNQKQTWSKGDFNEIARQNVVNDLKSVFDRYNRAADGTAIVENTYSQTIIIA